MKTTKKLFSLLLALVLTVALCAPAFADAETGSITIKNAKAGETYTAYKVFDLTYKTTTTTDKDGNEVSTTVAAYSFTKTDDNTSLYEKLAANDSPFTLTKTVTTNVYNVAQKENATADTISTFLKGLVSDSSAVLTTNIRPIVGEAGLDGKVSVVFSGLALGYYYVSSTVGSVVTLDNTTPNVEIQDKNEYPSVESKKAYKVDEEGNKTEISTAAVGDTVTYVITVNVPESVDKTVTLHDQMGAGLTFSGVDSIVVKEGEATINAENNYTATANKQHTDDEGNVTAIHTFDIEFAPALKGKSLTVTYTAIVNGAAAAGETGAIKNSAWVTYSEFTETPGPGDEPELYTNKVSYTKIDGDTREALSGVTFELQDASGNKLAVVAVNDENGNVSYYRIKVTGEETTEATITTATDGTIEIAGLDGSKTYQLVETETNKGYNLMDEAVIISFTQNDETGKYQDSLTRLATETTEITVTDESGEAVTDENGNNVTEMKYVDTNVIENYTGTVLPSTGGMGTTILTVVGLSIMVVAAVLLITKKRMEGKEEE